MKNTKNILCVTRDLAELASWSAALGGDSLLIIAADKVEQALELLASESQSIDAVVLSLPLEQEIYLAKTMKYLKPDIPVVLYNPGQKNGAGTAADAVARTPDALSETVRSLFKKDNGYSWY